MAKFFRVFSSQIFNAFFPLIIVYILFHLIGRDGAAQIVLLLNYANVYLLFSDYSGNIRLLKETLRHGGIVPGTTDPYVAGLVNAFLGVKILILAFGAIAWLLLCILVPLLHAHFIASLLSYSFIIGYNLSFYWIYVSSNREYYFIITNLATRLVLILALIVFIVCKWALYWVMPVVGLLNLLTSISIFMNFNKRNSIAIKLDKKCFALSTKMIKDDFPLVLNSFLLMTPSILASVAIGYVKDSVMVVVYGLAEKIYMGIRTLLSIFISSMYPVYCTTLQLRSRKSAVIFALFYAAIAAVCVFITFGLPFVAPLLNIDGKMTDNLMHYLHWFTIGIVVLSLNVPLTLWLIIHNKINTKSATVIFLIASILALIVYTYFGHGAYTTTSVAMSLVFSELTIVLALLAIFLNNRLQTNKLVNLNLH